MRELDNKAGVVLALNGLGVVYQRLREAKSALACLEIAFDLATTLELTSLAAVVQNNVIESCILLGELDRAIMAGEQSVAICSAEDDVAVHAAAELNLAAAYCLRGDQPLALECADRALALSQETGDRLRMCEVLIIRSESNVRRGKLQDAYMDAERARTLAERCGYSYAFGAAEDQRSRILSADGRPAEAALARTRAQNTLAKLNRTFRDPTIEVLLASSR